MSTALTPSLPTSFAQLIDPRRPGRTLVFPLGEILTLALCAAIGGANDWVAVEAFGNAKLAWFQRFLKLEQGIPSHDTFGRLFARLDPVAFQNCFRDWIADVCKRLGIDHVAIDGKRLAGSQDAGLGVGAIHLVMPGHGPAFDPGTSGGGREIQRDHGHSEIAGNAGNRRRFW